MNGPVRTDRNILHHNKHHGTLPNSRSAGSDAEIATFPRYLHQLSACIIYLPNQKHLGVVTVKTVKVDRDVNIDNVPILLKIILEIEGKGGGA